MKTKTFAFVALAGFAALTGACHHDAAKPTTPTATSGDPTPPPANTDQKPAPQVTQDQQVSPGLSISGDIASLCGIKPVANVNPTFDYDKDELTSDDRNILQQLATCMTTGPLKGHAVSLVGRADPRGENEYNMNLGEERAMSAKVYLQQLGVDQGRVRETSRGALDATGHDEESWRVDRRVDVELAD